MSDTQFPLPFPSVRGGDRHAYVQISIPAEDLFCPRPEIQLELGKESFILMEVLETLDGRGNNWSRPEDLTSLISPRKKAGEIEIQRWAAQRPGECPGLGGMGFPGGSAGEEPACHAGDPSSTPGSGRSPGEGMGYPLQYSWASLVAQMVKNPHVIWETWVQSLGGEDPLEESMATHSRILPGESPWTEESGGLQSLRLQRVGHA